jgi:hypothetical protein
VCFSAITNCRLNARSRGAARGTAISDIANRSASDSSSTGLPADT